MAEELYDGASIAWEGYFRVYFNAKGTSSRVWAIDDGDQSGEHNVTDIHMHGVVMDSYYGGKKEYPEPSGYLRGHGRVKIAMGIADIWPL